MFLIDLNFNIQQRFLSSTFNNQEKNVSFISNPLHLANWFRTSKVVIVLSPGRNKNLHKRKNGGKFKLKFFKMIDNYILLKQDSPRG